MENQKQNHKEEKKEIQVSAEGARLPDGQGSPPKADQATAGVSGGKTAEKTVSLKESEYSKLKEGVALAQEYWDKILRLQADFENTRKRLEREKQDFIRFANEGLIQRLLNILDDLERTVDLAQSKHQDLSAFLKGVEMILAHLYEMLKEYGVKPIEAQGKVFDANLYEALMQVDDNNLPDNTVVEELQKGYLLNDRVIRTAKVKVSKKAK